MVFPISGTLQIRQGGWFAEAGPCRLLVIPAGTRYSVAAGISVQKITIDVKVQFLRSQFKWFSGSHPVVQLLREGVGPSQAIGVLDLGAGASRPLQDRLERLVRFSCEPDARLASLAVWNNLLQLLELISAPATLRASTRSDLRAPLRREIETIVRIVREDPAARWTVAVLSRRIALSSSQLTRIFGAELGVSPARFIWQCRLEMMAAVLASEEVTVREVTTRAGWRSPSAASRAFRRRYGLSPMEFCARTRL